MIYANRRHDRGYQPVQMRTDFWVVLCGCPRNKILVISRRVGARLHLEADRVLGEYGDGVPDAGLNIAAQTLFHGAP